MDNKDPGANGGAESEDLVPKLHIDPSIRTAATSQTVESASGATRRGSTTDEILAEVVFSDESGRRRKGSVFRKPSGECDIAPWQEKEPSEIQLAKKPYG